MEWKQDHPYAITSRLPTLISPASQRKWYYFRDQIGRGSQVTTSPRNSFTFVIIGSFLKGEVWRAVKLTEGGHLTGDSFVLKRMFDRTIESGWREGFLSVLVGFNSDLLTQLSV